MRENIVIPMKKIAQVKVWVARLLEAVAWLIGIGLLGLSMITAGGGTLAWLVTGEETFLLAGLGGGLAMGLAGVWQVLCRLEHATRALRAPGWVVEEVEG